MCYLFTVFKLHTVHTPYIIMHGHETVTTLTWQCVHLCVLALICSLDVHRDNKSTRKSTCQAVSKSHPVHCLIVCVALYFVQQSDNGIVQQWPWLWWLMTNRGNNTMNQQSSHAQFRNNYSTGSFPLKCNFLSFYRNQDNNVHNNWLHEKCSSYILR